MVSSIATVQPAPDRTFSTPSYLSVANGRFDKSTRSDLASLFQKYRACDPARPLLVHFHGGLVDESSGLGIAQRLLAEYRRAGAYPVFFVWQSLIAMLEVFVNYDYDTDRSY